MKASKWIIAGVLAIALLFSLARILGPGGESSGKSDAQAAVSAKGPSSRGGSAAGPEGGLPSKSESSRPVKVVPDPAEDPDLGPPVYVQPEEELARVNGVVITLKDLMPLSADKAGTEQVMTTARYNFLLDRAVERELTFQAARAQGVDLNENQRQALARAAERRRNAYQGKKVFDDLQDAPENAEFQQRDFAALMLQSTLAERSGVPSPHVGPEEVQSYYEANRARFGNLPADPEQRRIAWEKIESEIRAKLAPIVRQQHQQHLAEFIQGLKEDAEITMLTQ